MANEVALPDDIQALLNEQLAEDMERESSSDGDVVYISTKGKKFRTGDLTLPNPLYVVIVAAGAERSYYDSAWDPNSSRPPACFAIGQNPTQLSAHEISPAPQHEGLCETCPHNEWGSGSGNGKACRESRRLALFSYDIDNGEIAMSQTAMLKLAPTTLAAFSSYTKGLANRFKRTTSSVVTKISFDEAVDYPKLEFVLHDMLQPTQVREVLEFVPGAKAMTMRPYNVSAYTAPEAVAAQGARKSKMS